MALATGVALVTRYHRGDETERQQLRAFAVVGSALAISFAVLVAVVFLDGPSALQELASMVFYLILLLSPVTVLFVIYRYRLYAIDHLVGRTVVYGALTADPGRIFAASLKVFEALITWVTGGPSDVGLVLTTLVLATTFSPIKQRLEGIVKRWGEADQADVQALVPGAAVVFTEAQRTEIVAMLALELERRGVREARPD